MDNEKYTQTNSTNEPVHCKDCQHLMFSDCYQKPNVEIRFIRGRLKFGDGKNSAPFPSMVVIFKSKKDET